MSNEKQTKPGYVYRSTLKSEYRLTDGLIKRLGPPDKEVANPHYWSGPSASLLSESMVLNADVVAPTTLDQCDASLSVEARSEESWVKPSSACAR